MARKDGLWKQKKLCLSSNPVARLWPWMFLSFSEYMHFILRERVVLMFVSQGSFEIYVMCRRIKSRSDLCGMDKGHPVLSAGERMGGIKSQSEQAHIHLRGPEKAGSNLEPRSRVII